MSDDGRVVHVIVDPRARRRGVGEAPMLAMAERIGASGRARWRLDVKVGNEPAIALYARMRIRIADRASAIDFPWASLGRLPREEGDIVTEPLAPDDAHLGVARFAPDFPWTRRFAVARPTLAAILLEGFRPHARAIVSRYVDGESRKRTTPVARS